MKSNCRLLSSGLAAAAGLAISATASAQLSITSSEPGTFIDISTTGTAIANAADDSIHQFPSTVGNAIFPAGTVSVCTNGFMCAGAATGTGYGNVAVPGSGIPVPALGAAWTSGTQGYMLPWWDDLYASINPSTTIYHQEIGGVLIVQWHAIYHFGAPYTVGEQIDFEVKVFGTPVNGVFAQYLYADTTFGGANAGNDNGLSATIGYCNDANINGSNVQWSLNSASVAPGTVLSIKPGVTGACCRSTGACTDGLSPNTCAALGGVYQGDNSLCSAVTCPPPGACCLPDGTCSVVLTAACAAQGGTYGGNGSTCATACPNSQICASLSGQAVPISDSPVAGTAGPEADLALSVAASQTITAMKARIRVTHTYQGDLRVRLVHPDSTSIDLVARPGVPAPKYTNGAAAGFLNDNFGGPGPTDWMTFEDSAASGVYDDAVGFPGPPAGTAPAGGTANVNGTWQAEDGAGPSVASLNTTFGGKNTAGTWHLLVSDHFPIDTGTVNGLSLCFAPAAAAPCYANCDGSTIQPCLNVQDFSCFLNRFSNGESYANCDNSTINPVLNVQDFSCFLNKFSIGCSNC